LQNKNQVKLSLLALKLFIKLESTQGTKKKKQKKHSKKHAFFKIGYILNYFKNRDVSFILSKILFFKSKKLKLKILQNQVSNLFFSKK